MLDVVPPKPKGQKEILESSAVLATFHPGLLFISSNFRLFGFLNWPLPYPRTELASCGNEGHCCWLFSHTPLAGCGAHAGTWYGSVRYPFLANTSGYRKICKISGVWQRDDALRCSLGGPGFSWLACCEGRPIVCYHGFSPRFLTPSVAGRKVFAVSDITPYHVVALNQVSKTGT